VFTFTDHIHLSAADLALDPPRRSHFAFVSHGHADHIGRHAAGFATPATVALVAHRLGRCKLTPLAFGATFERRDQRIHLASAGHVLGAAQIVVDASDGQRLVYTGDFSVRDRGTIAPARPIRADVLITECTFGSPQYVFPSDDEIRERIRTFVESALGVDRVPALLGYSLGKAQEAMAIAASLGYPIRVERSVAVVAEIYRANGVELGPYQVFDGFVNPGEVLVGPPGLLHHGLPPRARTLYLTGWAVDRSTKYRMGVDEALPLSDHADFTELVRFVEAVAPSKVYTTHGPPAFAHHLQRLGFNAEHLGTHQLALF
jgi:Cft2 family RNA processing exonuclease